MRSESCQLEAMYRARVGTSDSISEAMSAVPGGCRRDRYSSVMMRNSTMVDSPISSESSCAANGSEFHGFLKDRYTTLPETDDRLMATKLTAIWRYGSPDLDADATFEAVRSTLLEVFAETLQDFLELGNLLHELDLTLGQGGDFVEAHIAGGDQLDGDRLADFALLALGGVVALGVYVLVLRVAVRRIGGGS